MKRKLTALSTVLLLLLALFAPCLAAQAAGGLSLSVTDVSENGSEKTITVQYDNQTGHEIACGWVGSCELEVTTDTGIYTFPINEFAYRFETGSGSMTFQVSPCPGTVQSVAYTDLRLLDDRGLPQQELGKVSVAVAAASVSETDRPSEPAATAGLAAPTSPAPSPLPAATQAPTSTLSPSAAPTQAPAVTVVIPTEAPKSDFQKEFEEQKRRIEEASKENEERRAEFEKEFEQSRKKSETFNKRFDQSWKMGTIFMVGVGIAMLLGIFYRIIEEILKRKKPEADRLLAGKRGEKDVDYRLRQWAVEHPAFRAISRDCQSKWSDECILLRDATGGVHEIDHLLVGPPGVLHIETKSYSGIIQVADSATWIRQNNRGSEVIESPTEQVLRHEKALESILGNDVNIGSIICIANENGLVTGQEKSDIPIIEVRYLSALLDEFGRRAGHTSVDAVCAALERAKVRDGVPAQKKQHDVVKTVRHLQLARNILGAFIALTFVFAIIVWIIDVAIQF